MIKKRKKSNIRFFKQTYNKQEFYTGIMFVLPVVILGIIFIIMPMVTSLAYAFTDANLLFMNKAKFAGVAQFQKAFNDPMLIKAFRNTLQFVIGVVPLQLTLAMGLALILNSKIRFNLFFRWVFFVPVMLSLAITSMLWTNLLNEDAGLINALAQALGFGPQKFLSSPKRAMNIIILISAWQGAGYQMLIFLSGLKNIPIDLYEAGEMDGANAWYRFWHITMPSIKPTFVFVFLTTLISAFRLFTQPMIMTQGGPLDSTMTMSYYIYQQGITFRNVGYSSAIALIYTVFLAAIALTIRKVFDKDNTI
jgi:fructooligosaccharide transport system permease protein